MEEFDRTGLTEEDTILRTRKNLTAQGLQRTRFRQEAPCKPSFEKHGLSRIYIVEKIIRLKIELHEEDEKLCYLLRWENHGHAEDSLKPVSTLKENNSVKVFLASHELTNADLRSGYFTYPNYQ